MNMTSKGDMKQLAVLSAKGIDAPEAARQAGFDVSNKTAAALAEKSTEKFKVKLQSAYEMIGLDAMKIATTHCDIIDNGKDGDRLKAIDQVLGIMDVNQKEVNGGVTFEQAIINITNTVNMNSVDQSALRQALIEGELV